MSPRRHVHIITPGDHYSPRTGSAIPTVVHGLCGATPEGEPRPAVVVRRDTYPDRYDSAEIIEYDTARPLRLGNAKIQRYLDGGLGSLGLPRVSARHELAATLADQDSWEPSIVFAHNAPQLVPVIDVNRHVPVLYAHNNLLRTYSRWESRRALDRVAAIICVSDALAEQTASHLPRGLRERIRVVRNGVDFEAFHRENPLQRSGPLKVVFVGRMIPEKGAAVLLDAVVSLDRPDIHLTLVGSSGFSASDPLTSYEREVRAKAALLGGRVDLRPFVPRSEVPKLLQGADVVVIPSRWPDPCPLTVLEGMAAGAAVIGSDIGGIPETLRGSGLVIPPGDLPSLAKTLLRLTDDEAEHRRIANSCLDYARRHDWASTAVALRYALDEHHRPADELLTKSPGEDVRSPESVGE